MPVWGEDPKPGCLLLRSPHMEAPWSCLMPSALTSEVANGTKPLPRPRRANLVAFQSLLQKWRYPRIRFTSRLMSRPVAGKCPQHALPALPRVEKGWPQGGRGRQRDLGPTLGCVGTQSKPEGISAALGNPCGEVCLLREEPGWSPEPAPPPSAHAPAWPLYVPALL